MGHSLKKSLNKKKKFSKRKNIRYKRRSYNKNKSRNIRSKKRNYNKSKKNRTKKTFQKGGDNTYEMLRLVCGDIKINPTYGLYTSGDLAGVSLASNLGITRELGEVGEEAAEAWWGGIAGFLSPSKSSEIFKSKIKNLIRGEIMKESGGWKDSKGYSCKDWTPEKCASEARGGVFEKSYSQGEMNEVRTNCEITCQYGKDNSMLMGQNISLNKRGDYVQSDINFSGSSFDWPQSLAARSQGGGAREGSGKDPTETSNPLSKAGSDPEPEPELEYDDRQHISYKDDPGQFSTEQVEISVKPREVLEAEAQKRQTQQTTTEYVKPDDAGTKLGPAVYLCVYIGDPNRGGTQSTTGWYNSDYIYTSILVSNKDNTCKEYNLKYKKPTCEGTNPRDNERTCNYKQMKNHRKWVLEQMSITGYDDIGHKDLQDPPRGGFTGKNGVEGYRLPDVCTMAPAQAYVAERRWTDNEGKKHHVPAIPARCNKPTRAGTVCGKRFRSGGNTSFDKWCNRYNVSPSSGSHLEDKRPDESTSTPFGLCNYCIASGINMTESTSRKLYSNTETRDKTDHFKVIGNTPEFRFAIFMGHADKEITDLGVSASERVEKTDNSRKNAAGQTEPLFRAELIRGKAGDDLCLKFCIEMMKNLNIRCIDPGRTKEQEYVESWKKMNEPDFIQCYKILSYIVENKWAWTGGAFGTPETTYIESHLPDLSAYIKDIDDGLSEDEAMAAAVARG